MPSGASGERQDQLRMDASRLTWLLFILLLLMPVLVKLEKSDLSARLSCKDNNEIKV